MSIFEPPTEVQPVLEAEDGLDEAAEDTRRGFDPRSVQIAAIITATLVALGLLVSNAAEPDPDESRPPLASKVAPGAAAVEEAEGAQGVAPVPAPEPVAPAPLENADSADDAVDGSSDQDAAVGDDGGKKGDGHPGKGHGRWR
jgi:hypothetical protein